MSATRRRWARAYGASGWHLALMLASLLVIGYILVSMGPSVLWDSEVWWQSIAVWFVGAVIFHDLVPFPAYALADRILVRGLGSATGRRKAPRSVPVTNYVRAPTMLAAFTFLLFFPGILQHGSETFTAATGLTQTPFLERWLLLVGASYLASALLYSAAVLRHRRRDGQQPGLRRSSGASAPRPQRSR